MRNRVTERDKKETTITLRCTMKLKEQLQENANKNGKTLSCYLLDTGIAGLESKQSKRQNKVKGLVKLTQPVNDLYAYLELDREVLNEKFDNVMKGIEGLWGN